MPIKDCPIYKEPCHEHDCRWYQQLLGKHPQKDAPVPEWDCVVIWILITNIENSQQIRHFAASVDSARNEGRVDTENLRGALVRLANAQGEQTQRLIETLGGLAAGTLAKPVLPDSHQKFLGEDHAPRNR